MEGGKELVVRKPKAGSKSPSKALPIVDGKDRISADGVRARRAAMSTKKDKEPAGAEVDVRSSGPEDEAIGDVDDEWETTVVKSYDDLQSSYNHGAFRNLWQVLFPASM